MAAFAVHAAMHIRAMAANAISFLKMKMTAAFNLTGMAFFSQAITLLQTIVVALGAGLGVWGVINLLEGRWTSSGRPFSADRSEAKTGNDNPGANAHVR